MPFHLNFSRLDAGSLQREKITIQEITEVYKNPTDRTEWESLPEYSKHGIYYYLIGFTSKKRFLEIIISCDETDVFFLDVRVADLDVIREKFFKLK